MGAKTQNVEATTQNVALSTGLLICLILSHQIECILVVSMP
jgi:hypothetical protein